MVGVETMMESWFPTAEDDESFNQMNATGKFRWRSSLSRQTLQPRAWIMSSQLVPRLWRPAASLIVADVGWQPALIGSTGLWRSRGFSS
jgi:hypothetical protein